MESSPPLTTQAQQALKSMAPYFFSVLALVLVLEQISYRRKKGCLPGPAFVLPFFGTVFSMVLNTTQYWHRQAEAAASSGLGLSANYIAGRFTVFIRSSDLSQKVFTNVRPDAFHLIIHPFGKKLIGCHNIIYLFDEAHKNLRRRIAAMFTQRNLQTYAKIQQNIIHSHINQWLQHSSPTASIKLRPLCRDLNLETSQTVFAGPYLSSPARKQFNHDYGLFNIGLMTVPFDLPGFSFRRARFALLRLVDVLTRCVAESKKRMRGGEEAECLVDFWVQEAMDEILGAERDGAPAPPETADHEIGGHLFDFLFAAQDASTSSLCWAVALLDAHPDVLARVRAEVSGLWDPHSGEAITPEILKQMKYTEMVVKEVVRFRPPATMVPHVAAEDFKLTEWYTVPKGAMVFPSAFESSFQGFTEPDRFDPDRFSDERQEDRLYKRNFLVFGAGPHQCLGQRYAVNHLMIFVASFVSLVDFKRDRSDGCDELAYMPTIVPKDDCQVFISRRNSGAVTKPEL